MSWTQPQEMKNCDERTGANWGCKKRQPRGVVWCLADRWKWERPSAVSVAWVKNGFAPVKRIIGALQEPFFSLFCPFFLPYHHFLHLTFSPNFTKVGSSTRQCGLQPWELCNFFCNILTFYRSCFRKPVLKTMRVRAWVSERVNEDEQYWICAAISCNPVPLLMWMHDCWDASLQPEQGLFTYCGRGEWGRRFAQFSLATAVGWTGSLSPARAESYSCKPARTRVNGWAPDLCCFRGRGQDRAMWPRDFQRWSIR